MNKYIALWYQRDQLTINISNTPNTWTTAILSIVFALPDRSKVCIVASQKRSLVQMKVRCLTPIMLWAINTVWISVGSIAIVDRLIGNTIKETPKLQSHIYETLWSWFDNQFEKTSAVLSGSDLFYSVFINFDHGCLYTWHFPDSFVFACFINLTAGISCIFSVYLSLGCWIDSFKTIINSQIILYLSNVSYRVISSNDIIRNSIKVGSEWKIFRNWFFIKRIIQHSLFKAFFNGRSAVAMMTR